MLDNEWIRSPHEYRNIESGDVAVLGNGPSLKTWDLDRLTIPAIGVNRSYLTVKTKYHCFMSTRFFRDILNGQFIGTDVVVCPAGAFNDDRPALPKDAGHPAWTSTKIKYVPVYKSGIYTGYSYDLSKPVWRSFGGILGIMLAMWLGFSTIWLLGFDGPVSNAPHFFDREIQELTGQYWRQEVQLQGLRTWLDSHPEFNVYQTNPHSWFDFFDVNTSLPVV